MDGFQSINDLVLLEEGVENTTYLIISNIGKLIFRCPTHPPLLPKEEKILNEYHFLKKINPIYGRSPSSLLVCANTDLIGTPFYLTCYIEGRVLGFNGDLGGNLVEDVINKITYSFIENLALLHQIDIQSTVLKDIPPLGVKTTQFSLKQLIKQYQKLHLLAPPELQHLYRWLIEHPVDDGAVGIIHGNYRFDKIVFDNDEPSRILAVVDWQQSAVGNTFLDVGITLASWIDHHEATALDLKEITPSWTLGRVNRLEFIEQYQYITGRQVTSTLFYYIYGIFKIAIDHISHFAKFTPQPAQNHLPPHINNIIRLGLLALDKNRINDLL